MSYCFIAGLTVGVGILLVGALYHLHSHRWLVHSRRPVHQPVLINFLQSSLPMQTHLSAVQEKFSRAKAPDTNEAKNANAIINTILIILFTSGAPKESLNLISLVSVLNI